VVLAVDDAHLLDDLSAFVVASARAAEARIGDRQHPQRGNGSDAVTALWKDRHVQLLDLQPLSRDDSDQLLRRALDGPVDLDCARRMWEPLTEMCSICGIWSIRRLALGA